MTSLSHHYYSHHRTFEQSLDVVYPTVAFAGPPLPLVVLVVGSGWLGHRFFVYAGTSWWNSSAPKTIASLGAVCVCVRHRGAFPPVSVPTLVVLATIAGLVSLFQVGLAWPSVALASAVFAIMWLLWSAAAQGSATYEEMLEDVATALVWVRDNRAALPAHGPQLIFGGYSSGGHVAIGLLNRPDVLTAHGLPSCVSELCDGVLLVSGVLATRPAAATTSPRWFTDFWNRFVWGPASGRLPSPIHELECNAQWRQASAVPPHLLVGCAKEVFGWDVANVYFCSQAYASVLKNKGSPVRYVEIDSNHWSVLNSKALCQALRLELRTNGWPDRDKIRSHNRKAS